MDINGSRYYCQALLLVDYLAANEPLEKVSVLKRVSSAGSKMVSNFLSSKGFPTRGATPKPSTKMQTISILYYDCLTLSINYILRLDSYFVRRLYVEFVVRINNSPASLADFITYQRGTAWSLKIKGGMRS